MITFLLWTANTLISLLKLFKSLYRLPDKPLAFLLNQLNSTGILSISLFNCKYLSKLRLDVKLNLSVDNNSKSKTLF